MGVIIVIGIVLLICFFVFGRILAVSPEQKKSEDEEQMGWIKKHREAKGMR